MVPPLTYNFDWSVIGRNFTNIQTAPCGLALTGASVGLGVVIGIVCARLHFERSLLRWIVSAYIEFVRNVQFCCDLFAYYGLPLLGVRIFGAVESILVLRFMVERCSPSCSAAG